MQFTTPNAIIKQSTPKKTYPGTCRYKNVSLQKNPWRVYVPNGTFIKYKSLFDYTEGLKVDESIGDFIIKRRDGLPAYQIISLISQASLVF